MDGIVSGMADSLRNTSTSNFFDALSWDLDLCFLSPRAREQANEDKHASNTADEGGEESLPVSAHTSATSATGSVGSENTSTDRRTRHCAAASVTGGLCGQ